MRWEKIEPPQLIILATEPHYLCSTTCIITCVALPIYTVLPGIANNSETCPEIGVGKLSPFNHF